MAIGCNIARLSYIKLLKQTGEIEFISNEFIENHNIDKILVNLVISYRYVWAMRLFDYSLIVPKFYKELFNNLPAELNAFLNTIDSLSDEIMSTSVFQHFVSRYKNTIVRGERR